MIYRIKEKFWSWGTNFSINDENEQPVYKVDGEAFSWGDKLSVQDMHGKELAFISQKLLSFKPRYEIFVNGSLFAEVTKELSWFKQKFILDIPGPNDYSIEGSFWEHEYTFMRKGKVVATISKDLWNWTDCYGVETIEGEDDLTILCACIVIDQVLHDDDN
ncbi:MAG: hypothetical protein GY827_05000 [Cytophagales bacterium]|nr:hypothetical protein [Cytophagales bacterium]